MSNQYTFLIVENASDVCMGIIKRMEQYQHWQSLGYCLAVNEAIQKVTETLPDLLFLDWSLNGGSAFEVLQAIQNINNYNPYIIFNTGYQKDNPEIPVVLINQYKVDKYIVKPIWENLRLHLKTYLNEAILKKQSCLQKEKKIWLSDDSGAKVLIDLNSIVCIVQHPATPRTRIVYTHHQDKHIVTALQWDKWCDILTNHQINFFVTKSRAHLVIRKFIKTWDSPHLKLAGVQFTIEVVKEKRKIFEDWLINQNN
jgi:two-component system, LytTR family, response regulator